MSKKIKVIIDDSNKLDLLISNIDTIFDLKLIIFKATGICVSFQYIEFDTGFSAFDIYVLEKKLSPFKFNKEIDREFIADKENVLIIPNDFTNYANDVINKNITVYNLQNHINKITDKHLISLYYWGFVIKFFPMVTFDEFEILLKSDKYHNSIVENKQNVGLPPAFHIHKYKNISFSVSHVLLRSPPNPKIKVDIDNLFNIINAEGPIVALKNENIIKINVLKDDIKSKIIKSKIGDLKIKSNILTLFLVSDNVDIAEFSIHRNSLYEIVIETDETSNYSLDFMISSAEKNIKNVISTINDMSSVVLMPSFEKLKMSHIKIENISISIFWKMAMLSKEFQEFKNDIFGINNIFLNDIKDDDNSISFNFTRGIVRYNISELLENDDLEISDKKNLYEVFTNEKYNREIWSRYFLGRRVKIIRRLTDIKIIIANSIEYEIEIIKSVILPMIERRTKHGIVKFIQPEGNFLRRLREQDPNLFDLKKFDPSYSVYSVYCQSERQPFIYNEEEFNLIPKNLRPDVTEYHNFTTGKKAFYVCPSKEFPSLSFRTEIHPLGYCVPCCRKYIVADSVKQDNIFNECIKKHTLEQIVDISTRVRTSHIITYGRRIPEMRLGKLSNFFIDLLGDNDNTYFLHGFKNSSGPISDLYAIIYAINNKLDVNDVFNMTAENLIMEITSDSLNRTRLFDILDYGIIIIDENTINISQKTLNALMTITDSKFIVISKHPDDICYPIGKINSLGESEFIFNNNDDIFIKMIKSSIMFLINQKKESSTIFSLDNLHIYNKRGKFKIISFNTLHQKCNLRFKKTITIPISTQAIPEILEIPIDNSNQKLPEFSLLMLFINDFNLFVTTEYEKNGHNIQPLEIEYLLRNLKTKKIIGIKFRNDLIFYHQPLDIDSETPIKDILYDPEEVEVALSSLPREIPEKFHNMEKIFRYKNSAYNLYKSELADIIKNDFYDDSLDAKKISEIMKNHIIEINEKDIPTISSIFSSCISGKHPLFMKHCKDNKLLLLKEFKDDFPKIVSNELALFRKLKHINKKVIFPIIHKTSEELILIPDKHQKVIIT